MDKKYIERISVCIEKILAYTNGKTYESFEQDSMVLKLAYSISVKSASIQTK